LALFIPALMSLAYFRIFDIWKPSIIGRVDQKVAGGWGVMGDDVIAGFVAGAASAITWVAIQNLPL
jgi:phosphatidylglycerophosphatase A